MKTVLFHIVLAGKIEEDLVPRGGRRLKQKKTHQIKQSPTIGDQLFTILRPTFTYNQLLMFDYTKSNQIQSQFMNPAVGK